MEMRGHLAGGLLIVIAMGGMAGTTPAATVSASALGEAVSSDTGPSTVGSAVAAAHPAVTVRPLVFPTDYGSHPQFRTEWWYVTGWLTTEQGEPLGFQITFFRSKLEIDETNPSAFAPHQILIAHCAISDPRRGRLWQDQRIRRAGLGLAEAATGDTDVWIDRWSIKRNATAYTAKIDAEDFSFDLALQPTQAILLNGNSGISQKGPAAPAASYYYSLPHMRVSGVISRRGNGDRVSGEAWFDHEWSSEYLDDQAVGWDWIGVNLDDGAALMAFRIRGAQGEQRWAGGTLRSSDGRVQTLKPSDLEFRPGRPWTSPRTQISYPVQWHVRAGTRQFDLEPLLDDQENDTRLSTGAIYWEGAIRAYEQRQLVGRGYLELTGYGERLKLR